MVFFKHEWQHCDLSNHRLLECLSSRYELSSCPCWHLANCSSLRSYCKAHGFLQTWDTLFHLVLLKGELHIWFNPHIRWTRFYISPVFRSVVIQLVGRIRGVNFNRISAMCLLNSKTEKEQQLNVFYFMCTLFWKWNQLFLLYCPLPFNIACCRKSPTRATASLKLRKKM
jgi:hypothetical protein